MLRLLRGGVNIGKVFGGLRKISAAKPASSDSLATRLFDALAASTIPVTILLARRDNTAIAFRRRWEAAPLANVTLQEYDTDSHSFATQADKQWLFEQIEAALGN